MRALLRVLIAAGWFIGVTPSSAFAQGDPQTTALREPGPKQGYFIGLGARSGVLVVGNEELDELGAFGGFGGALRFGEMALPWLGFGGVAHAFFGQNEAYDMNFGAFSMEAQVAPFEKLDLAGRIAIGPFLQNITRRNEELALEDEPDQGFGAIITTGVSWDLFPFYNRSGYGSGGWALSVYADGQFLLGSDFKSGGAFLGLEISHFFGLPKNKLKLPVEEAY